MYPSVRACFRCERIDRERFHVYRLVFELITLLVIQAVLQPVGVVAFVKIGSVVRANIVRDLFAGITDILGGRSGAYEEELGKARQIALAELEQRAADKGANAVVGVDLDYEVINNMLMVSASGTAVTVEG